MNKLIILRGVSGSGKSTKASELKKSCIGIVTICSTDEFFIDPNSKDYNFDAKLLTQAHSWNRGRIYQAMRMKAELIILDNTNTQHWEMATYIKMAKQFEYEVEKIVVGELDEQNLKVYANRNKHGVPLEVIRKQAKRFQK